MSTIEERLVEARMREYADGAKTNAGTDKATLAIAAIESIQSESRVSPKKKKWLYLLSLVFPPVGFVFAAWYFFSKKIDGKQVALACAIITIASVILAWLAFMMVFASIPQETLRQMQTIGPNDLKEIRDLLQ